MAAGSAATTAAAAGSAWAGTLSLSWSGLDMHTPAPLPMVFLSNLAGPRRLRATLSAAARS